MSETERLARLESDQQLRHMFSGARSAMGKPPIPVNGMGHREVDHPLENAFLLDQIAANKLDEVQYVLAMRDEYLEMARELNCRART